MRIDLSFMYIACSYPYKKYVSNNKEKNKNFVLCVIKNIKIVMYITIILSVVYIIVKFNPHTMVEM